MVNRAGEGRTDGDQGFHARMLVIQRWRRVAWASSLLLALYAAIVYLRDPGFRQQADGLLVVSLVVFIVALLAAANFMTLRFRR